MVNDPIEWRLLTGELEIASDFRDSYDRTPSFASGNPAVFEPIVSRRIVQAGFRPTYPGGAPFAVCLSHDIDVLFTSPRETAGLMRRGTIPRDLGHLMNAVRRGPDPRYRIQHLLDAERKVGARSSFYFLALRRGDEDHNFDVREIRDQFDLVRASGGEIGLHGGHRAYRDGAHLKREQDDLARASGQRLVGFRNHYLRFKVPDTWQLVQDAGFRYDSTFGFSDIVGFRNGMCHPFRPMNANGERLSITEIPLHYMDATLMFNMYLEENAAWRLFLSLLDRVKACSGVMTVLWHNNYMHTTWGRFYGRLLEHLHRQGAWFATGAELVEHWIGSGQQQAMEAVIDSEIRPR